MEINDIKIKEIRAGGMKGEIFLRLGKIEKCPTCKTEKLRCTGTVRNHGGICGPFDMQMICENGHKWWKAAE